MDTSDKIFLQGLRLYTILGVYEQERLRPQEVWVDITLHTDTHRTAERDDLEGGINYAQVAEAVRELARSGKWHTVEALAEDIARLCLERFRAQSVGVKVQKPQAVRGATAAGVEIERRAG